MALAGKRELFKGRMIRVNCGSSEKTNNGLIQISVFNGATKEAKGIFVGEGRRDELIMELETAAQALRADAAHGGEPPLAMEEADFDLQSDPTED